MKTITIIKAAKSEEVIEVVHLDVKDISNVNHWLNSSQYSMKGGQWAGGCVELKGKYTGVFESFNEKHTAYTVFDKSFDDDVFKEK